jgi:hypothetical protein
LFGTDQAVSSGECIGVPGNLETHNSVGACPSSEGTHPNQALGLTDGPVPSGGATVTDLEAEARTAPASGRTWLVEVLEANPSGSTTALALSCIVTSSSPSCSSSGTHTATAGNYFAVRITKGAGTEATHTQWRVSFRY